MTLAPQAQAFVDFLKAERPPGWESMGVETARSTFAAMTDGFGTGPSSVVAKDMRMALSDQAAVLPGHEVDVRIYRPAGAPDPAGVVVFCHGGGWVLGDLDTHDAMCRRIAHASAMVVMSVDYLRSPETNFPGPIDDCLAAVLALPILADKLRIDINNVFLMGDSAGGHLAASVALRLRKRVEITPRGLVLLYPVISPDFDTPSYLEFAEGYGLTRAAMLWFWESFLGDLGSPARGKADLLAGSLAGLPPTHVVTAGYDVLRDEGNAFADAAAAAGVAVTRKQHDGMLHGFMHFAGMFDEGVQATTEIGQLLRDATPSPA